MKSNGGLSSERVYVAESLESRVLYSGAPVEIGVDEIQTDSDMQHERVIETTKQEVQNVQSGGIALQPVAIESWLVSQEQEIQKVKDELAHIDFFLPDTPIQAGIFTLPAFATLEDGSVYDISKYIDEIVSIDTDQVGASQVEYLWDGNYFSYGHKGDTKGVIIFSYDVDGSQKKSIVHVEFEGTQYINSRNFYHVWVDEIYADMGREKPEADSMPQITATMPVIRHADLPEDTITLTRKNTWARSIQSALMQANDGHHQKLAHSWKALYVAYDHQWYVKPGEAIRLQLIATTLDGQTYDVSDFASFRSDAKLTEVSGQKGVFYNDGQNMTDRSRVQVIFHYRADGKYYRGSTLHIGVAGAVYEERWLARHIDRDAGYMDSISARTYGTERMRLPLGFRGRMIHAPVVEPGDVVSFGVQGDYGRYFERRYGRETRDISDLVQIHILPLQDGSWFPDFVQDNRDGTYTIGQPEIDTLIRFKITYGDKETIQQMYALKKPPIQGFVTYVNGHIWNEEHPDRDRHGRLRLVEWSGIHTQIFADYWDGHALMDVSDQFDLQWDRGKNPGMLKVYAMQTHRESNQVVYYGYMGDDLIGQGVSKRVQIDVRVYDHKWGEEQPNTHIHQKNHSRRISSLSIHSKDVDQKNSHASFWPQKPRTYEAPSAVQVFMQNQHIDGPTIFIDTSGIDASDVTSTPSVWYLYPDSGPINLTEILPVRRTVLGGYVHFWLEQGLHVWGKSLTVFSSPIEVISENHERNTYESAIQELNVSQSDFFVDDTLLWDRQVTVENQYQSYEWRKIDFDAPFHITSYFWPNTQGVRVRSEFETFAPVESMIIRVNDEEKVLHAYANVWRNDRTYNQLLPASVPDHQCTQLIQRYLVDILDLPTRALWHGWSVATNLGNSTVYKEKFEVFTDGSAQVHDLPQPGSIISMETSDPWVGHVAIVKWIRMTPDGNTMYASLIEQNIGNNTHATTGRQVIFVRDENNHWSGTHMMHQHSHTLYAVTAWANLK